uniref:Uncharacterized protein n=1 Tax=Romanomermis culicivorax TaxID=13658 RepID=A0A915HYY6_ROMCU
MSKKVTTNEGAKDARKSQDHSSSASDQDGGKKVSKDKDDQPTKFLGVIRTEVVAPAPKKGALQLSKNLITKRLTTAERLKITGGDLNADSKKKHKKKHKKKKKKHKKKEGSASTAASSAASSSTSVSKPSSSTSTTSSVATTSSLFGSLKTGTAASLVAPSNKSVTQDSALRKISFIKDNSTKEDDDDEQEEQENGSKNVKNTTSISKSTDKPEKKA